MPEEAVEIIAEELERFSPILAGRERWLVLNKVDLLPEDERDARCQALVDNLSWAGPVYKVAAISATNTERLCQDILTFVEAEQQRLADDPEAAEEENRLQEAMQQEARDRIAALHAERRARRLGGDDDDSDDDDFDVEVVYQP